MSNSKEQYMASEQSPYVAHVDAALDRFEALIEHVQKLTFPRLRIGVTAPPDMTHWSRLRRIAFMISSPLLTTFKIESFHLFFAIFGAWVVASKYWGIVTDVAVQALKSPPPTVSKPEQTATWVELAVLVVATVLAFGLIPAAYWRWIEFFRDRRYTGDWRWIRLILTLLVVIIILALFLESGQYYSSRFQSRLLENRVSLIFLAIIYVLFRIPQVTFYSMVVIDLAVFSGRLLWVLLNYLISHPFPKNYIRKIVLEPISSSEGKEEWRLTELTKAELESLRRWAEANREGTEKRLLPTLVLFGILAVFANTQTLNHILDQLLTWLFELLSKPMVLSPSSIVDYQVKLFVFIFVVGVPMALFIVLLLLLFRNLVTQSLIIEACIVAEHVREQCKNVDSRIEMTKSRKGFWQWLVSLLWRC